MCAHMYAVCLRSHEAVDAEDSVDATLEPLSAARIARMVAIARTVAMARTARMG